MSGRIRASARATSARTRGASGNSRRGSRHDFKMQFVKPIRGTAAPAPGEPPSELFAFYWHFVSQSKGWYAAMFAASLAVALLDTVIPPFIGRLVSLMEATDRMAALAEQSPLLIGMVALVLIVRPLVLLLDVAIRHNALIPGATSLIP